VANVPTDRVDAGLAGDCGGGRDDDPVHRRRTLDHAGATHGAASRETSVSLAAWLILVPLAGRSHRGGAPPSVSIGSRYRTGRGTLNTLNGVFVPVPAHPAPQV